MKIAKDKQGAAMTVSLAGRLDTTTAPELEAALKEDMEGLSALKLDLAELEYLSSAGLRVILSAMKQMSARQGAFVVAHPTRR